MRTAPAQSTISYRNYTQGSAEKKKNVKIKKVPGAARQVKDYGLSLLLLSSDEVDRGLKVSHLLEVKEFLSS